MSHDFARSRRPAPPAPRKKKSTASVPTAVWALSGTAVGALVMYLVYVFGLVPPLANMKNTVASAEVTAAPASKVQAVAVTKEPPAPSKRTSPVFEFYTRLPSSGAPSVDSAALATPPTPPATTQTPAITQAPATSTTTADMDPIQQLLAQQEAAKQQADSATRVPVTDSAQQSVPVASEAKPDVKPERKPNDSAARSSGRFALQAGAFRKRSEADALRAKLMLLGVKSSIQSATNAKGEAMHKVIAGPFASEEDMDDAKIILGGNHISTIPVK